MLPEGVIKHFYLVRVWKLQVQLKDIAASKDGTEYE